MIPPNISNEALKQLPVIHFEGKIIVVDSLNLLDRAIKNIKTQGGMWGFDTETRPSFKKGRTHKVSLIQLAQNDICYLFRINLIGLRNELIEIFTNPQILKIGLSIRDDLRGLHKLSAFEPKGFVDLQDFVEQFGIQEKSLKKLCGLVLNARISKNQQTSNWEAKELSEAQQIYAATDAWVCLKIYEKLNSH